MPGQHEGERSRGDALYFEAHREELLKRYPEQWVAILKGEVVGADPNFDRLLDQLQDKGLPLGDVFIEQTTATDELLILPLRYEGTS